MNRKIFATYCLDQSQSEWTLRGLYTDKRAAIQAAYDATQTAVRCNRPMEWWKVLEHLLPSDGEIIWGCEGVTVGECE